MLENVYVKKIGRNGMLLEKDNIIYFMSYESLIFEINRNNHDIKLYQNYNYSSTTSKERNKAFYQVGFNEIASISTLRQAINNKQVDINGFKYDIKLEGA